MTHLGLFEGIGGFSLAARWMGWHTLAWCEWNEFGQRVLRHHFPEAEGFGDITKTNFSKYHGKIDIITGGFPCQPYSMAGKRKGKDDQRHLWPEMLRVIREVCPRYVVGENVLGLVNWSAGMVFEEVQADLEAQGYEVLPFILPACSVGAPHLRYRVFFVAYSDQLRLKRCVSQDEIDTDQGWVDALGHLEPRAEDGHTTHANDPRLEGLRISEGTGTQGRKNEDRSALEHTCINWRTLPAAAWEHFPTVSPLCGGDDGLPDRLDGLSFSRWRTESVKAYGNAIVPQVALQLFRAIAETEKILNP